MGFSGPAAVMEIHVLQRTVIAVTTTITAGDNAIVATVKVTKTTSTTTASYAYHNDDYNCDSCYYQYSSSSSY